MDRKTFLTRSVQAAVCSCGAFLTTGPSSISFPAPDDCPECTPCAERVAFAKTWVTRMMDILDQDLDAPTRRGIMQACGRACYRGAHGETAPAAPGNLDDFLSAVANYVGPEHCYREGDVIRFDYVKNPRGLKIEDGYCLCPLVEDGPRQLSATYCQCSVGYVGEMFGRVLGYRPEVELLESLRGGGSACRFAIHLRS